MKLSKEEILATDLFKNFTEGDLVFGLHKIRGQFTEVLKKEKTSAFATIDEINNKIFYAKEENLTGHFKEYFDYIASTKYSKVLPKVSFSISAEDLRIRRSCKAAISWPTRTIHFCLDNINLDPYVFKKYDPHSQKIDSGFTIAELRYIYRHKDNIKNNIIFYMNGTVCDAPWQGENQVIWEESYQKKPHEHLKELQDSYTGFWMKRDVQATPVKATNKNPAEALDAFNKRIHLQPSAAESDTKYDNEPKKRKVVRSLF